MQRLVTVDDRNRVTLGSLATQRQYLATTFEDGRIVLEPAVVLTTAEQRVSDDPEFWARVAAAASEPAVDVPSGLLE